MTETSTDGRVQEAVDVLDNVRGLAESLQRAVDDEASCSRYYLQYA